jgi:PIN domain nuclease of toxin-antitoxin system
MNILLDTHVFIWFAEDDKSLPSKLKEIIEDEANDIFVSIVAFWEIAIKKSINKLELSIPFDDLLKITTDNGIEIMPILFEHTAKVEKLDFYHRDPFDRIIIAQGLIENMYIATQDTLFDRYKVKRIWHL